MGKRITFKVKTGYHPKFLTPEAKKLLGSTEEKIDKDKNDENVPPLEVTEAILVHCNIINNAYHQDSRVFDTFVPNKIFIKLLDISLKNLYVFKNF